MIKPKILHIVTALSWRGGEQQVAYLIEELKNEVDSILLCSEDSKMETYALGQHIKHYSCKKSSGIDFSFAKQIKKVCEKETIDIIHLHDAHAHTFAILAADIFGNKTPIILSRRVDFPIKNKWSSKYKYDHKAIKRILCVSDKIKEITARGISEPSKLYTVYSGIDTKKFSEPKGILRAEIDIQQNHYLVGNTSALADHKDYFTFLDTAKIVSEKDESIKFVIIGDGPMKQEIIDYSKRLELQNSVVFTGFRTDINNILADLDLFFISSKTEGLGTSILDAFAAKVPVLATAAGGIPELVKDGKTGILRDIKSTEALADAILYLKSNRGAANNLALNALEWVKKFDKTNTAKETYKHYQEVLSL